MSCKSAPFFILALLAALTAFSGSAVFGGPQDHDKIVETVFVGNVEIAVRVFNGQTPVKGLKKSDFQLFLDGKPIPINGFYEENKQLGPKKRKRQAFSGFQPPGGNPRIFVLIFNLSDYRESLSDQMDVLFNKVIRRGDRLIVISNRHFFPEWVVTEPRDTKARILSVLKKEVERMRLELLRIETKIHSDASWTMSQLSSSSGEATPVENILREFMKNYQSALDEIREQYLQIPIGQYIKVSEYLRGQKAEKWALVFYQIGRLPMLRTDGRLGNLLSGVISNVEAAVQNSPFSISGNTDIDDIRKNIRAMYYDFSQKLLETNNFLVNDTGKAFLNSGAVFHTMLIKPVLPNMSQDYKYESISTESENILKKISHLTGGTITTTNRMNDFVNGIIRKNDTVYTLTYAQPVDIKGKKPVLKVTLKSKKYDVIFDDQKREKYFNRIIDKLIARVKDLEITSIVHLPRKRSLMVQLANIQLVDFEDETFGAVRARLKIKNGSKRQIVGYERTYKGIKKEGLLFVDIPRLPHGQYTVILEIRDLFSLKNIFIGDAVTVKVE